MTVLVFPSSLEASRAFARDAKDWNQRVVGASSLKNDAYAVHYDHWEHLPYINEETFIPSLQRIIAQHGIDSIYTPHAPTYLRLSEIIRQFPSLRLRGDSPYAVQMQRVQSAHSKVEEHLATIASLLGKRVTLQGGFLAALLADAAPLYGECSQAKMVALCAAFADAPKGDVVEIGTFFGKSIYVMNRLAAHFAIGATLAVDPWKAEDSVQYDSPDTIQKLSAVWDWDIVFQGFLLTMQARFAAPFNYLRKSSVEAWKQYDSMHRAVSAEFGDTEFTGSIAVLHLDGNHDEKAVAEDFEL